jgi:ATP adenylyltransferase/5',5'''-P-1,P-4-tetraphosphate phosphorylase II
MTANQKKVKNAFADTNPDFYLGQIGPNHKLILNKYSVVRPQFVLPTLEFEPQSSPLNATDSAAVWDVLVRLGGDYIAIFNCGAEAGASVGHKHMQILPHPERKMFTLFPDTETLRGGKASKFTNKPTQAH